MDITTRAIGVERSFLLWAPVQSQQHLLAEYTSGTELFCCFGLLGSTVVSPYVGMARKQNGSYNASINVQTLIFHLVVNSTRLKTVRSALWRCPNSTVAIRLLENVVKVTNLEVVKIEFRHLPILLSSFFSQPSALTRAVLKTKHTQIAVKFFEDVPFELSF